MSLSIRDQVSAEEWAVREDLAACYRLVALYGWDDLIYTHISARIPGRHDQFLINPYGMMFEEITASSLVKIDLHGNKLSPTVYPVNAAGFIIHGAIHEARPDVACVLHLHSDYGIAVGALAEGLLPMSQTAVIVHSSLAYHDFEGIAVREGEKTRLVDNLGDKTCMILRNHGTLTAGASIAHAFEMMHFLERACKSQILAMSSGQKPGLVSAEAYANTIAAIPKMTGDFTERLGPWPALRRKLDRLDPSYKE